MLYLLSAAKDGLYSSELQLRAMITRPGKNLQEFLDTVGDGIIYKGVTLKRMPNDLNAFVNDKNNNSVLAFQIRKPGLRPSSCCWIQEFGQ